tara:strand:- start:928 stop:1200 length:273 start_codon:yes stop_codon:yes gene_type:complete
MPPQSPKKTKVKKKKRLMPPIPSTHYPFRKSRFITTSRMIRLFSQPAPLPITPKTKVVYVNGGWDMFHSGHAQILEKAKKLGKSPPRYQK